MSRSISPGDTFAGWFRPGTPVANTVTRSLLGFGGTLMPKSACRRPASSELTTNEPKFATSFDGSLALKRSFLPSGITTSFTSGMPRRDTCVSGPVIDTVPSPLITVFCSRSAVSQMPMTLLLRAGSGAWPSFVSRVFGICSTTLMTL